VAWNRVPDLRATQLILLEHPHSTLGQDSLQLGQMRVAEVQHVRLPADAHSYRGSADTAAVVDLVRCARRASRTAIRTTAPARHVLTIGTDALSRSTRRSDLAPSCPREGGQAPTSSWAILVRSLVGQPACCCAGSVRVTRAPAAWRPGAQTFRERCGFSRRRG
jgi:hypothetical protein